MKDNTYPDPLSKWSEKKSKVYGLAFAKAIGSDWFGGGMITDNCNFAIQREKIRRNRKYVRGENSIEKAKKFTTNEEGDESMLNLDYAIINEVGKYANLVSNGIRDSNYSLDVIAKDKLSLQLKQDEKNQKLKTMRAMPLLQMAKKSIGVDMIPQGFIPRDEEELNIYEQMKEKPMIEIAEEIIIKHIKDINNWKNIEKQKNNDAVAGGLMGVRVYTCPRNGIKIQQFDIEDLVFSLVKNNDFSDAKYYGYVDTVSIGDIAREGDLTDIQLREIAKLKSKKDGLTFDYNTCKIEEIYGMRIDVLRFCFATTKEDVYKKSKRNGKTVKVTKKDENYNPPERNDYGKLSSVKGTWMEGSYVIGSEIVYNYYESENIVRDELDNPIAPFVVRATDIYEGRLHAFLDKLIPIADEMQRIHLKIQHLRSEFKPPLIEIDEDVLASVDSKTGKVTFHKEVLNILNVKGVIIKKRIDMGEMGMKDGSPATPKGTQTSNDMAHLLNLNVHFTNKMRDITGINPAADGSLPHDALLGVSQMAELKANTITEHIVDAAVDFNKRVCEVISTRVHAIFRNPNAKHLQEQLIRAVGKRNIDAIEPLKNRHLHDFGFAIEMTPTSEAIKEFKEDLGLYLQQGLISPEIKSEATRISKSSLKLANQYLAYMSKKRQEEKQQQQEQMMQMETKKNIESAKQASEGRIQEEAIKTKMKLQLETAMSSIRVSEKQALLEIEAPGKAIEFEQDVYLEKIKSLTKFDVEKFKEDEKEKRAKSQSTRTSKQIFQRQNNTQPIDFEDNLDFGVFN